MIYILPLLQDNAIDCERSTSRAHGLYHHVGLLRKRIDSTPAVCLVSVALLPY